MLRIPEVLQATGYITGDQATILVKNPPGQYSNIPDYWFRRAFLDYPISNLLVLKVLIYRLNFSQVATVTLSIGNKAFNNCPSGLTEAAFPPSLTGIGSVAFALYPRYGNAFTRSKRRFI